MKNAMQLKAAISKMAKEKHIPAQLVMQNYMLERLLERISRSKYQGNFILKGGLLIASMVGLHSRATMDSETGHYNRRQDYPQSNRIQLSDDVQQRYIGDFCVQS